MRGVPFYKALSSQAPSVSIIRFNSSSSASHLGRPTFPGGSVLQDATNPILGHGFPRTDHIEAAKAAQMRGSLVHAQTRLNTAQEKEFSELVGLASQQHNDPMLAYLQGIDDKGQRR